MLRQMPAANREKCILLTMPQSNMLILVRNSNLPALAAAISAYGQARINADFWLAATQRAYRA